MKAPSCQGHRRIMLAMAKVAEYRPEDVHNRDGWNDEAVRLEQKELITIEWHPGLPVMERLILNMNRIMEVYAYVGDTHPAQWAQQLVRTVMETMPHSTVPWIDAWLTHIVTQAKNNLKLPHFYKEQPQLLDWLLRLCQVYEQLQGEPIMTRVLSVRSFQDSKFFERHVKDEFLRIAKTYNQEFREQCEQEDRKTRDELLLLGIYSMPEMYELTGPVVLRTHKGMIDVRSAGSYGLGIPSDVVNYIEHVDMGSVQRIVCIENKTNYHAYAAEADSHTLVLYQGGFMSPQQQRWVRLLISHVPDAVPIYFWGDMDLGGIRMFYQLQQSVPALQPYGMDRAHWDRYKDQGLTRPASYWNKVKVAMDSGKYEAFQWLLTAMLEDTVTVEQEVFMDRAEH